MISKENIFNNVFMKVIDQRYKLTKNEQDCKGVVQVFSVAFSVY